MKSKILSRPMFAGAIDPENVGIMHGFKDSMNESLKEAMEEGYEGPEKEDDDEENESGKMIGRTPRSPEILMNTLRGDMRSMSARRMELADLVGEQAARETPEEVLTLLQAKLGQGIASVPGQPSAGSPAPGGATPPPPPPSGAGAAPLQPGASPMAGLAGLGEQLQAAGVPAPAAPPTGAPAPAPGAGPTAPGPLNMADGGEVSYERYYAGGGAVEKKNESVTDLKGFFKPDKEAIKKGMADYSSLYADILGDPKEQQSLDKALMLAQIAQRGFNFAANVSPTGTPLSGSFAARAAGAFGDVPGILLEGTKNQREREQKLKLAAFEAARQDESESRKLMAQYAIAGMKKTGSPKTTVTNLVDQSGKNFQQIVQQDADGNIKTYIQDMQGNPSEPSGQLYKLGTPNAAKQREDVLLYDVITRSPIGRGYRQPNGEVTDLVGAAQPSNVVAIEYVPSALKSSMAGQQAISEKKDALASMATTTSFLKNELTNNPSSVAALAKVATLLDSVKAELAAVPAFIGVKDVQNAGEVVQAVDNLANTENYNWGRLAEGNVRIKQGILTLALQSAKASGMGSGRDLSNKEVQQQLDVLTAGSSNPDVILSALENNLKLNVANVLSQEKGTIASPDDISNFYSTIGYSSAGPYSQNPVAPVPANGEGGFSYRDGDLSIEELP